MFGAHSNSTISVLFCVGIGCMGQECAVLVPEDFILTLLTRPNVREKYQRFAFRDYVNSHPQLR